MPTNQQTIQYSASMLKLADSFHSGNLYLDSFLKSNHALNDNFGKTYVLLSENQTAIIGYYNIGVGYIEQIEGSRRHKMGGSVHINCFALDEKYHGLLRAVAPDGTKINLSDVLLDDCIQRIEALRIEHIGFTFITLSSTKEGYSLYQRNGFDNLEQDMSFSVEESDAECTPMYLALDYE